jgi:nitrite reductase/ring-hydroxylating ferredoxin subunit
MKFCSLKELQEKKILTKWIDSLRDELTAIEKNGEVKIFSSICPHFGGEFYIDLKELKASCKWHKYQFDLKSGKCLSFSTCAPLRFYSHKIRDGNVEVEFL